MGSTETRKPHSQGFLETALGTPRQLTRALRGLTFERDGGCGPDVTSTRPDDEVLP